MSEQVYVVQLPEEERRAALEELVKRALSIDEAEGEGAQRRAWIDLRMAANRLRSLEEKANASHD